MSKNIAPKKQFNYIKLLYIVGDFLLTGLLVGLTFLSQVYKTEVPIEKVWGDVIFSKNVDHKNVDDQKTKTEGIANQLCL